SALPMPGSTQPATPAHHGFWGTLTSSVGQCYRATPLFGQEAWKRDLLIGFAVATVLLRIAGRIDEHRRRNFTSS
ncbi:MAG: hypothetical protein NT062_23910, partial [Proteobacteria bacterium]|nr:hypothetical protein [Pseudomonadota bacterium]